MDPQSPNQSNEPKSPVSGAPALDPMMRPAETSTSAPVGASVQSSPQSSVPTAPTPNSSLNTDSAPVATFGQSSSSTTPDVTSQTSSVASASTVTPEATAASSPLGNEVAQPSVSPVTVSSGGKKKWLIPVLAGGAALILLAGGYVFGMYLPNRPEAMFSKSLEYSGVAADKLIEYANKTESSKAATLDGTMSVKSSGASMDATIKGESDSSGNAMLTMNSNIAGQKMTADITIVDTQQSDNPDIYLKVSGVKELLTQMGSAQLAALDGQWISVDHTLMDTYQKQMEESTGTSLSGTPTPEQLRDAMAKAQQVNKEYIFTSDANKSVVTYQKFVGKETKNGREVNHYVAGYDKAHLKAYVEALGKALDGSKLNEWAKQQAGGKNVSDSLRIDELKSAIDKEKGGETFDLYVDLKTRVVQSVVFTSTDNKQKLSITQNYTGGDVYPFELGVESTDADKPGKFVLGMSVNTKSDELGLKLNGDMTGTTIVGDFKIVPSDKTVKVVVPTGAKPVTEIMKQLGLDQSVLGAQTLLPSATSSKP